MVKRALMMQNMEEYKQKTIYYQTWDLEKEKKINLLNLVKGNVQFLRYSKHRIKQLENKMKFPVISSIEEAIKSEGENIIWKEE
jgi:hypothetical protein